MKCASAKEWYSDKSISGQAVFYVAMTRQKAEPSRAMSSSMWLVLLIAVVALVPAQGLDTGSSNSGSGRGFSSGSGSTGIVSGNGIIGYNHVGGSSNGGGGVGIQVGGNGDSRCPRMCTCSGQTVDCSNRGLGQVPRRIPVDTERL